MLALKSPDCVCNSWPVDPSTRIVALTPAISNEPLTVLVRDAFTSTPEILSSANPSFLTSTEYLPGKSASMRYDPDESVSMARGSPPRSRLVASTVAPATPAPDLSTTAPAMVPLLDCDFEIGLRIKPRTADNKVRKLAKRNTFFIYCPHALNVKVEKPDQQNPSATCARHLPISHHDKFVLKLR